jgi:hypothetical protein
MNAGRSEQETHSTHLISTLWAVSALKSRRAAGIVAGCGHEGVPSIALKCAQSERRVHMRNRDQDQLSDEEGSVKGCTEMYTHQGLLTIFHNFPNNAARAYLLSRLAQVVYSPDLYQDIPSESLSGSHLS